MAYYLPCQGQAIVNSEGLKAAPLAQIYVFNAASITTPSTIYGNSAGGTIANPFSADINGNFLFWAAPGAYYITVKPTPTTGYSYYVSLGGSGLLAGGLWGPVSTYASLPAASSTYEGTLVPISDSNSNTWGAAITASGANHVLAYCNGTAWTVAAK